MITGLDHVVILLDDLDAGIATYQTLLARKPSWRSSSEGAELAIFTLANMSIELMAPHGDGTAAKRIRAVLPESGATLASIPVLILFMISQRYIIEGVSRSGLKG